MIIFLMVLTIWLLGAAATAYGTIRWGEMETDDEGFFFLCAFWPIALPLISLVFGFFASVEYIEKLAASDAEKDRQKRIDSNE